MKLILQTQAVNSDVKTRYNGLTDCFKRVYQEQGLLSFWRGNGANLLRYFPHQALSFAFKDKFRALAALNNNTHTQVPLWKVIIGNVFSAGAGGGLSLIALYPLDMARTRLAADVGSSRQSRQFNGTIDCLNKIYKDNGMRGIYTGIGVSITGVVVFRGLFMGGYDSVKYIMDLDNTNTNRGEGGSSQIDWLNIGKRLLAAQVVTVTAGTLCYPIDTVRRRVMMQSKKIVNSTTTAESVTVSGHVSGLRYNGAIDAFFTILKEEGYRGIYSGLSANLIRGFAGPILLVSYDIFKEFSRK